MVELERVEADEDIGELLKLIELHHRLHRLDRRRADPGRLDDVVCEQFVKVMPTDYKRVLMERRARQKRSAMHVKLPTIDASCTSDDRSQLRALNDSLLQDARN